MNESKDSENKWEVLILGFPQSFGKKAERHSREKPPSLVFPLCF